ncbi:hypothetical protein [Cupriavidus sp. PET2-C1]
MARWAENLSIGAVQQQLEAVLSVVRRTALEGRIQAPQLILRKLSCVRAPASVKSGQSRPLAQ